MHWCRVQVPARIRSPELCDEKALQINTRSELLLFLLEMTNWGSEMSSAQQAGSLERSHTTMADFRLPQFKVLRY